VFHRGVRCIAITIAVLLLAGCGGGNSRKQASVSAQPAPVTASVTTTSTTETSSSTTEAERTSTHRRPSSSSAPLRVTAPYTCKGKPLRAIAADGPVKVDPAIVKPGQSFTVTVTDRSVKVADVSLTGVSATPISARGVGADDGLAARLKMPRSASCGNKLLEIEGDLSAEAYVGVSG
jgi:hypothetical protein